MLYDHDSSRDSEVLVVESQCLARSETISRLKPALLPNKEEPRV
jgi:hypothetical protein